MPLPLLAAAIAPVAGAIANKVLGIGKGPSDEEQYAQQEKLQGLQLKGAKEMADYSQQKQMEMWQNTGYEAQKKQMEAAGLNPGLMYGMGGGGGQSTGSGAAPMPTGATASGAAERQQASNAATATGAQMGMMLAQQQLMKAQTEKTQAEAEKIKGVDTESGTQNIAESKERTKGIGWENMVKEAAGINADDLMRSQRIIKGVEAEKENLQWEAFKATGYPEGDVQDQKAPANIALKAGWENVVQTLKNAKAQNDLIKAESIIKQFTAELTKNGIAEGTPWYVKMVSDLLSKVGMNPIEMIKGGK